MKILIAPDKFKASLSATQVARALAKGIQQKHPAAQIVQQPMADGGEGSIDILQDLATYKAHTVSVHDPLFRKIKSTYYTQGSAAFIEMAKASGLSLLSPTERNPMLTSSLGTGELILDAFHKGFENINLFIGGSATNDGGIGIAQALGFQFLDQQQKPLLPIGKNLVQIDSFRTSPLALKTTKLRFCILCDVNNPFYGANGAAQVYAAQKGASPAMILQLDQGLQALAQVFVRGGKRQVQHIPGAGAAGGVGGGMLALFAAQLVAGTSFFIEQFDLAQKIQEADVVISGEGQFDQQSLQGKLVGSLVELCQRYQKPLHIVCGKTTLSKPIPGVQSLHTIMSVSHSETAAMQNAAHFLQHIGSLLNLSPY